MPVIAGLLQPQNNNAGGPILQALRPYVGNHWYLPPGLSLGTYVGDAFADCRRRIELNMAECNVVATAYEHIETVAQQGPMTPGAGALNGFNRCIHLYRAAMEALYGAPVVENDPHAEPHHVLLDPTLNEEALERVPETEFLLLANNALRAIERVWLKMPKGERRMFARELAALMRTVKCPEAADALETWDAPTE